MMTVYPTGLSVRVRGKEPMYSLNYQWAPFSENPKPIPWIDITERDITYPHIRCYQIKTDGEDLPFLISTLESANHAVALILINNDNTYQIHPSLVSQDWNVNFPILVIKFETGCFLKKLLKDHDRNAEAKVEAITQTAQSKPGL